MLSENLENLIKKERQGAVKQGWMLGMALGRFEATQETARKLIAMNILTDLQIAEVSGLTLEEIGELRSQLRY